MLIKKKDMAVVLAGIDTSVQNIFPVTDDTETAFNDLLESVPQEFRQGMTVRFMALQNALFLKLGKMVRAELKLDINDPLLAPNSPAAREVAVIRWEAKEEKAPEGSGNPYANINEEVEH